MKPVELKPRSKAYSCSVCKGLDHNRSTCEERIEVDFFNQGSEKKFEDIESNQSSIKEDIPKSDGEYEVIYYAYLIIKLNF